MLRNTAKLIFLQGAIAEVLFGSRNLKERNRLYRYVSLLPTNLSLHHGRSEIVVSCLFENFRVIAVALN